MKIEIFSEAYIRNTNSINITDTNKAILCRNVLSLYEEELLNNLDGCIFKICYIEPVTNWKFTEFISCLEFTAPDNIAFIPDIIYNNMCTMNLNSLKDVTIELYNPPQASSVTFRLSEELLNLVPDLKLTLEKLLFQNYKFIKVGQYIPYLNDKILVSSLEPDNICLVNNTDLEVDFEIIYNLSNNIDTVYNTLNCDNKLEKSNNINDNTLNCDNILEQSNANNDAENTININPTSQQLRELRLKALEKKKN